ncbi:MAG: ATP-binding protein, partial [Lachnospiraceae bacterium]|nr:ATP-binding protein [Lachnospiraceae bacterium]
MNPFDISFGKKPTESVARHLQFQTVVDTFSADIISNQIFMLTGIRGSGKTVLMNQIANYLEEDKNWIVVRLNPEMNLLQSLGAKLADNTFCSGIFRKSKISVSIFGISMEIPRPADSAEMELTIEKMLKAIKKSGKRLLVTIDEVTNNPQIRVFASSFQIFLGEELPVFLLMTGLYENIEDLRNVKNLTFLYRAPRVEMSPLNAAMITDRYMNVFGIDESKAKHMADLTKGYPFAFQALGFSFWNHKDSERTAMVEYKQLLEDFVYDKIWSGLSPKDRRIMNGIAHCPDRSTGSIVEYLGLKKDEINPYRNRLIRKGIINGDEYGLLKMTLPLFDEFVISRYSENN